MDGNCRKYWRLGLPCRPGQPLSSPGDAVGLGSASIHSQSEGAGPGSIVFSAEHPKGAAPIPGYNALAPLIKTVRDPALSLIALSGIDPTEPVMVEVPLVLNNTTATATQLLSGWRIGFAGRYVYGDLAEPVEHSATFYRALDILRQAGAQLVAVDAQRADDTLQFSTQIRNEIDELVTGHRLDALVSDGQSAAFHRACRSGYPRLCEALEDGTRVWFYSARWARDSLTTLSRVYRQGVSCELGGQSSLQGVLNPPTA
nr:amidase family protein [Pseudomonas costantinii]